MASQVQTVTQKINVTEIVDIQITEIIAADGVFTRAIRIYGEPYGTDGPPVLEVLINAEIRSRVEITTPEVNF